LLDSEVNQLTEEITTTRDRSKTEWLNRADYYNTIFGAQGLYNTSEKQRTLFFSEAGVMPDEYGEEGLAISCHSCPKYYYPVNADDIYGCRECCDKGAFFKVVCRILERKPNIINISLGILITMLLPNEVINIATDPGTVNHSIIRVAFSGYKYVTDKNGQMVKMPQIRILNWELWDLKRKLRYSANEKYGVTTNRYDSPNNNAPNDSYVSLSENMAHFVADSPWMFESYQSVLYGEEGENVIPAIVTELQCGVVKNGELEVVLMSYELPTCVKAIDITRSRMDRQIVSRARKYGIPSDGKLTYAQRKAKSDEVGRSLLRMLGMHKWLEYIDNLLKARKRDVPHKPPQSHDMFDSLLLGLASCDELYHNLLKLLEDSVKMGDINAQAYLDSIKESNAALVEAEKLPLQIEIDDDDDEEEVKTTVVKKKRKPSTPKKKSDIRKRADNVHQSFIDFDEEKKRKRDASEMKSDLNRLLIGSDESLSESEEAPKKKRKKRKVSVAAKKYTQLKLT
jgi:hypothetical protein